MKKLFKKITAVLFTACLIFCLASVPCLADGTSTIACNTSLKVGDSVTVTVNFKGGGSDSAIWGVEGTLTYSASVLTYQSSTVTANPSGSTVKFTFAGSGSNSAAATFTFTAIAAGTGNMKIGGCTYSGDAENSQYKIADSSVIIKVTEKETAPTPTPSASAPSSSTVSSSSSNANLSSLSVSAGSLEPAFSASTTSYRVTASNDVVSCSVSAKAAESRAKVSGTGDAKLNVGDNKITVTVTAADGTKKNYTVNIYRQTAEETAAANAGSDITPEDPLAVTIGSETLKIVADISALYIPEGYTIQTEKRGETDVQLLKENDGDITLYYLTDATGTKTQLYSYDAITGFEQLRYITVNGKMYILKELEDSFAAPDGYYESIVHLSDTDIEAYKYEDENLADFYILYCYSDGELAFYRYDTLEKTLQRAPEFKPDQIQITDAHGEDPESFIDKFSAMSNQAKLIIILLAISIICILVLIALVIAKLASKASSTEPAVFDPETDKKPFEKENVYNGFEFDDDTVD